MLDRSVLRIGGGAAMVGAVLALVFNLLHPRGGGNLANVENELQLVADSDIWLFDHFMLAWSLAFILIGFVAIGWSFADGPGATWGRIATAAAIVGVGVAFITIVVDGMAMKAVADDWARNPDDPAALATARPVAEVSLALFTATIGGAFGLAPTLFGVAILSSDQYPKALGWLVLASGLLGLIVASVQFLAGPSAFVTNVLFTVSAVGSTVWLFAMGMQLWRGPATAGAAGRKAVTTA